MFLYQIVIRLYFVGIWLAAFFSDKPRKWIAGRKLWKEALKNKGFDKGEWVWFHCSSFGEFQEGKFLLGRFKSEYPRYKILLTFFSPSGFEAQKDTHLADAVFYLPLDTANNANYFLNIVKPKAVFFLRGDLWPNFITTIHQKKIPQFLVSFIFSSKSFTGFPQRYFYSKLFTRFNHVFVQNEASKTTYIQNVFGKNVSVCGNLRVENILETVGAEYENTEIKRFIGNRFCVIAGSTHAKDAAIFLETVERDLANDICWIIVPHEINQEEIKSSKLKFAKKMACLSELESISSEKKLLWIDRVGILAKIYRYADVVFIGGGFNKAGVHSFLEAVAYGCPVCFGSNYRNYAEALDLLNDNRAAIISNATQLGLFIQKYKTDPRLLEKEGTANKTYLAQRGGATEKILSYIRQDKYLS